MSHQGNHRSHGGTRQIAERAFNIRKFLEFSADKRTAHILVSKRYSCHFSWNVAYFVLSETLSVASAVAEYFEELSESFDGIAYRSAL